MDWSFFDKIDTFFSEMGDWISFLSQIFEMLPSIFGVILSAIIIISILCGLFYLFFKIIG